MYVGCHPCYIILSCAELHVCLSTGKTFNSNSISKHTEKVPASDLARGAHRAERAGAGARHHSSNLVCLAWRVDCDARLTYN